MRVKNHPHWFSISLPICSCGVCDNSRQALHARSQKISKTCSTCYIKIQSRSNGLQLWNTFFMRIWNASFVHFSILIMKFQNHPGMPEWHWSDFSDQHTVPPTLCTLCWSPSFYSGWSSSRYLSLAPSCVTQVPTTHAKRYSNAGARSLDCQPWMRWSGSRQLEVGRRLGGENCRFSCRPDRPSMAGLTTWRWQIRDHEDGSRIGYWSPKTDFRRYWGKIHWVGCGNVLYSSVCSIKLGLQMRAYAGAVGLDPSIAFSLCTI